MGVFFQSVWSLLPCHEVRMNQKSAIGDDAAELGQLQRSDAEFMTHRDGANGSWLPSPQRAQHAARFGGEFNTGARAKTEPTDVFIEAFGPYSHADVNGA